MRDKYLLTIGDDIDSCDTQEIIEKKYDEALNKWKESGKILGGPIIWKLVKEPINN